MNTSNEVAGTQITLGCVPSTTRMSGRSGGKMTYSVLPKNPQRGILLQVTDGTMTIKYRPNTLQFNNCDGVNDSLIIVYGPLNDLYKAISEVEYTTNEQTYIYRFFVFNSPPKINVK